MIITINGDAGSGKSTVGKMLAKKLKCPFYSIGDLMGKIASEKKINLQELQKLCQKDEKIDKYVDSYQTKLAEREKNFVIDSRLGWHFIPKSFKIMIVVDEKVGAKRIFRDQRPDEKKYKSVAEVIEANRVRKENDKKRYLKYYGIDSAKVNYDLVIDSSELSPAEIVRGIIKVMKASKFHYC